MLAGRLATALATPGVGATSALVVDLATGEVVYARNAARSLAPASTEKLAVTVAALTLLGPEFRIETTVLGEGRRRGAVWRGDLVLQGHGDPGLARADLRALAETLRADGLRRVSGAIVGDESFFDAARVGPGWKPSYYIVESPPLSALSVDRGRYLGRTARDPARAAAAAFQEELAAAGITVGRPRPVTRPANPYALPLAFHYSPPLAELLRAMNLDSDNFAAELLLKQLGAVGARAGSAGAGSEVLRRRLAALRVPLAGVRVADGSGLSLFDRLTARALVAMLRAAWSDPELREPLVRSLPVAGRSGTLTDRMRRSPARGRVRAKTGTTSRSSALAGFVRDRYVFAVVQNGSPVPTATARAAQDRFVSFLAAQ